VLEHDGNPTDHGLSNRRTWSFSFCLIAILSSLRAKSGGHHEDIQQIAVPRLPLRAEPPVRNSIPHGSTHSCVRAVYPGPGSAAEPRCIHPTDRV